MPNATLRATARTMPKPKPGAAESIRRQTAELETATALLNAAKAVEREGAEPNDLNATVVPETGAIFDLEMDIRRLQHLTTIVAEWATEQNFYHPDISDADEDMKREWGDQIDRLIFAIEEIAERVHRLHGRAAQ